MLSRPFKPFRKTLDFDVHYLAAQDTVASQRHLERALLSLQPCRGIITSSISAIFGRLTGPCERRVAMARYFSNTSRSGRAPKQSFPHGEERGLKDNEVEHIASWHTQAIAASAKVKSLKSEVENWSDYRGRFVGRKKGQE